MFIEALSTDPRFFFSVALTVIVSICVHELAHGVAAICCGDRTPIEAGHMTLNPAVHVSPVSIICLLLAGIAWGSMPISPQRLRGRHAQGLVAVAGPLSNVLLAALALSSLGLWQRLDLREESEMSTQLVNLGYLLWVFGVVNVHLALFNLIPVPPLDGSQLAATISGSYARAVAFLQQTGAILAGYIILFSAVGTFTAPLARTAAVWFLGLVRGY